MSVSSDTDPSRPELPEAPGWSMLILDLHRQLTALHCECIIATVYARQGRLEVHCECQKEHRPAVEEIIRQAELRASHTCEECGHSAMSFELAGLTRTLCDLCNDRRCR